MLTNVKPTARRTAERRVSSSSSEELESLSSLSEGEGEETGVVAAQEKLVTQRVHPASGLVLRAAVAPPRISTAPKTKAPTTSSSISVGQAQKRPSEVVRTKEDTDRPVKRQRQDDDIAVKDNLPLQSHDKLQGDLAQLQRKLSAVHDKVLGAQKDYEAAKKDMEAKKERLRKLTKLYDGCAAQMSGVLKVLEGKLNELEQSR